MIELIFELFILSDARFRNFRVSLEIFSDKNVEASEKSEKSTEEKFEKSKIGKFGDSVRKSELPNAP